MLKSQVNQGVDMDQPLSLKKALEKNRLADFIVQEEARGVGSADSAELERLLAEVAKPVKSADQTSRSADPDGWSGK